MRLLLVTSLDSLGMEIGKLMIHIIFNFNLGIILYRSNPFILWVINWNIFILLVVLSNAEGNKITVAEAGGVQQKIFPRVLANKVGYLLAIFKNSITQCMIYHLSMINLHNTIIPFQARQILLWWQRFKLLLPTTFWGIRWPPSITINRLIFYKNLSANQSMKKIIFLFSTVLCIWIW